MLQDNSVTIFKYSKARCMYILKKVLIFYRFIGNITLITAKDDKISLQVYIKLEK